MADEKKAKGEQQPKPKGDRADKPAHKGDKGGKRKGGEGASAGPSSKAVVSTTPAVPPRLHEK